MRLTKRDRGGNARKNCEDCEIKFSESCCSKQLCLNALIEKLAAYEDTGLEPEAIDGLRLSLCGVISMSIAEEQGYVEVNRAYEIAHAEAEGRLVILPCKVGDTVYVEWSDGREYAKSVVEKISIGADGQARFLIPAYLHSHSAFWYQTSDFGKTVFLTCDEAEAALKKGEQG